MAIVDMDGYESGLIVSPNFSWSSSLTVGGGRDGIGIALRCGAGSDYGSRTIAPGSDTLFWHQGVLFQPNCFGSTNNGSVIWMLLADSGVTAHICVNMDSTGHLTLRRGGSTSTIIATSTLALQVASIGWRSVETKATIHDTTGEVIVKIDGVEWLNYTGDTRNGGTSTRPDVIRFGMGNPGLQYVDDFLMNDTTGASNNSWTGEVSIVGIRPNGNGANSALVGSDGNSVDNYLLVDEVTLNTTDYVGSVTPTALDTYAMSNVGKVGTVVAVKPAAYAAKSDAGAKAFKHVQRSGGGSVVKSADVQLSTSWVLYQAPILLTDADGSAWTVAKVDAAEFGFEVV